MPLEETYPGFADGIAQLRTKGFTEAEIERAIAARMSYLKKAGGSPEAVAALARGKPSPYDIHVAFDKQGQPDLLSLTRARAQLDEWHNRYHEEPDPFGPGERWLSGVVQGVKRTLEDVGLGGDVAKQDRDVEQEAKLAALYGIPQPPMAELPSTSDIVAHALYENEAVKRARQGLQTMWEARPRPGGGFGQVVTTPAGLVLGGMEAASAVTGGIGELVRRAGTALAGPGLGTEAASMTAEFLAGHAMTPPTRPEAGGTLDRPQALAQAMGEPEPPPSAPAGLSPRAQLIQDFTHPEATGPTVTTRVEPGAIPGEFFRRGAPRLTTQFKPAPSADLALADIHNFAEQDVAAGEAVQRAADTVAERAPAPPVERAHADIVTDVEGAPPAETPPEPAPPRRRGRPITRSVEERTGTKGISDDAARTVLAGWKTHMLGMTNEEALSDVAKTPMDEVRAQVGAIQKQARIATGAQRATGRGGLRKPGMPESEVPSTGSELVDEMMPRVAERTGEREVALPEREVVKAPVFSLKQLRQVADSKGWDLQYDTTDTANPVRLIANGGSEARFKTLDAVAGYLETQDAVPKQPIELPVAETGDTAFERQITGQPLTEEHKIHMRRQRVRMQTARSRPGGLVADDSQQPATEITEPAGVRRIELKEGQLIGSVEDLPSEAAAQVEMAKIQDAGLKGRVLKTPNGREVVFYRDLTTEVSRLMGIHRRVLEKGPEAASVSEHRVLGRAFGVPEDKITEYILDNGLEKRQGIKSREWFQSLFADTLEEVVPEQLAGRTRVVNILAGTQNSGSPIIRLVGHDMTEAHVAANAEMRGWKMRLEHLQGLVPNTEHAQDLAEGLAEPRTPKEEEFIGTYHKYREDFFKRATSQSLLKQNRYIANYATHRQDLDGVYSTIRDEFVGAETYRDLDLKTQMIVSAEQYGRWRDALLKHPTRQTMPRNTLDAILAGMKDWHKAASTPADLPDYIKNNLPAHVYVKYFQPRSGSKQYVKDFYGNTADYMNDAVHALHFDPVVQKWDPVIRKLGGEGTVVSERDFIEKMMNSVALRRPSSDKVVIDYVTRNVNQMLGHEMLKTSTPQALTQLVRDAFLRGTVGFALDSAFRHMTHIGSAWLANGRFTGPFAKSIVKLGRVDQSDIFQEFLPLNGHTMQEMRPDATTLQKFAYFSGKFTRWALSPIQLPENVSKGMAMMGGWEDAARRGLSSTETMKLGFAAASDIIPDTRVTEAYWGGLNSMLSSQTTMLPHMRSPYMMSGPLGRLSNIFMVFPTHAYQFVNGQVRTAFAEAIMRNDQARLVRWLAAAGGLATLYQSGHYTGINWDDFFAGHAVALVTAVPFFRTAVNGVRAAMGEPSITTEQAKHDFINTMKQMAPGYPSWRYGGKLQSIVENVRRGYATDQMGRRLYEIGNKNGPFYTSEWGELMRALGVQPQVAVDARAIAHTIAVEAFKRGQAKREAIHQLLQAGDPSAAMQFGMKYGGQGITSQDLAREVQRQTELYSSQLMRKTPRGLRPEIMEQMEALH